MTSFVFLLSRKYLENGIINGKDEKTFNKKILELGLIILRIFFFKIVVQVMRLEYDAKTLLYRRGIS